MPETIIGLHLELTDADKTQLESFLQNTATLNLKTLMDILSRATSMKITLIASSTVSVPTVTETVVYPTT